MVQLLQCSTDVKYSTSTGPAGVAGSSTYLPFNLNLNYLEYLKVPAVGPHPRVLWWEDRDLLCVAWILHWVVAACSPRWLGRLPLRFHLCYKNQQTFLSTRCKLFRAVYASALLSRNGHFGRERNSTGGLPGASKEVRKTVNPNLSKAKGRKTNILFNPQHNNVPTLLKVFHISSTSGIHLCVKIQHYICCPSDLCLHESCLPVWPSRNSLLCSLHVLLGWANSSQTIFHSGDIPRVLEAKEREPCSPVGLHGIPRGRWEAKAWICSQRSLSWGESNHGGQFRCDRPCWLWFRCESLPFPKKWGFDESQPAVGSSSSW